MLSSCLGFLFSRTQPKARLERHVESPEVIAARKAFRKLFTDIYYRHGYRHCHDDLIVRAIENARIFSDDHLIAARSKKKFTLLQNFNWMHDTSLIAVLTQDLIKIGRLVPGSDLLRRLDLVLDGAELDSEDEQGDATFGCSHGALRAPTDQGDDGCIALGTPDGQDRSRKGRGYQGQVQDELLLRAGLLDSVQPVG